LFLEDGEQAVKGRKKKQSAGKDHGQPSPKTRRARLKADTVVARVKEMIEPVCNAEGMELVQVEYQREPGGRVLRLYIDKPGGIGIDDCVAISRQAGDYLDVGLGIDEAYRLEVSSPGTERPLVKEEDFDRFKGHEARLRTREALDGRKNFKGVLLGMAGGAVRLSVDGDSMSIPFEQVEKAKLAG
jgi:ribosome maturation factor RimP